MTRRVAFKKADVSRALLGARSAGLNVTRVEIDQDGKIILLFGRDDPAAQGGRDGRSANEWDEVFQR